MISTRTTMWRLYRYFFDQMEDSSGRLCFSRWDLLFATVMAMDVFMTVESCFMGWTPHRAIATVAVCAFAFWTVENRQLLLLTALATVLILGTLLVLAVLIPPVWIFAAAALYSCMWFYVRKPFGRFER